VFTGPCQMSRVVTGRVTGRCSEKARLYWFVTVSRVPEPLGPEPPNTKFRPSLGGFGPAGQTPKWRPLRPGVFALNADGMAGPAGDSSDHAVGPNKVYDPPSLGSFRRRWEAMAGQAGAPSKVEDKICGTGWNGLERSKSKFFDMWAKRPIMSDINFLGNFGRHPNFHNICLFESSDKG